VAGNWRTDVIYYQEVAKPLLYAESILGKGHLGQISVKEASRSYLSDFGWWEPNSTSS
jgi:hypothetical protein